MKQNIYLLLAIIALFTQSCTEPYALQTDTYENAIVVEATITDENKLQEIKLSRTYRLEEDGPDPETGAVVYVTDSNGNQYNFTGNNDKYISQQPFAALPNVNYQLHVVTSDGKTYTSENEKINSSTSIEDVTAVRGVNSKNEDGVQIFVKSTRTSNGSEYYRYDYEETNKVVAPQWKSQRGRPVFNSPLPSSGETGYVVMEAWPYEAKTCYLTEKSKEITIANTSLNQSTSTIDMARFLNITDYKTANRYSIMVTMYNESLAAYNYYDALKKMSSGGSMLSQNQPGFYSGNIKNVNNPKEKVIGFFDVAHVSNKRIFFDFEDIFPSEQKPDYPYYCPEINELNEAEFKKRFCFCYGLPSCPQDPGCSGDYVLISLLDRKKAVYQEAMPFYYLMNIQCGDCTSFSSNVRPSFWVD